MYSTFKEMLIHMNWDNVMNAFIAVFFVGQIV